MKTIDLAHACISQLSLLELRINSYTRAAEHQYSMSPTSVERFVYITKGMAYFYLRDKQLQAGAGDMVYLPGETVYHSRWPEDSAFMVIDLPAQMCGLSTGRFRRVFSECLGMTPVEYRNKLRMQKVVTLLKSGTCTVGEVAEAVGISDIKYFSKLFKRYTGVSPSTVKKYQF